MAWGTSIIVPRRPGSCDQQGGQGAPRVRPQEAPPPRLQLSDSEAHIIHAARCEVRLTQALLLFPVQKLWALCWSCCSDVCCHCAWTRWHRLSQTEPCISGRFRFSSGNFQDRRDRNGSDAVAAAAAVQPQQQRQRWSAAAALAAAMPAATAARATVACSAVA